MTKKEIEALPEREWGTESIYDSILVCPTGKKYDSGRSNMWIIGLDKDQKPIEKVGGWIDDLNRHIPPQLQFKSYKVQNLRTDWQYRGQIRFWCGGYKFHVGRSLSSTDITLIPDNEHTL